MNIIFICTGNICRSPFAEYLARKRFPQHNYSSMGTEGLANYPSTSTAIAVAEEFGIDLTSHKSHKIKREDLDKAGYIFVMDKSHKAFLEAYYPHISDKVYLLASFGKKGLFSGKKEVKDPFRKGKGVFRKVFAEIETHLERIIPQL